jgi:hypothetical protein
LEEELKGIPRTSREQVAAGVSNSSRELNRGTEQAHWRT